MTYSSTIGLVSRLLEATFSRPAISISTLKWPELQRTAPSFMFSKWSFPSTLFLPVKAHFENMKDGAVLCNSGHFNVEIDIAGLEKVASSKRDTKPMVEEYVMRDGRKVYVLGEGRLINLAAAEGHPASVMDMSFANQALSVEYLLQNAASLDKT